MSKTVKITKAQISTLINEEVKKFKRVQELENRKKEIFSQLNEMYEIEELNELGLDEAGFLQKIGLQKDPAAEKAALDAKTKEYDTAAQAYIAKMQANPQVQKNPKLLQQIQQAIATQKPAAIQNAVQRGKEWGAKGGHFSFVVGRNGQVVAQYEQGNIVPATGMGGLQPGSTGSAE
jgi:hypothetical protein